MTNWTLLQFKNIVDSFLDDCSSNMREILERRLDTLSEKGNMCERPVSAPLGDGLFELRGKANKKQARLIYYFGTNRREIIFTHACYKASKTISPRDMEIAKRNRKSIEEGREKPHGLNYTH